MIEYFDNYDEKYPKVVIELMEYFEISNTKYGHIKDKTILKFCQEYGAGDGGHLLYQPQIISRICKRLCDCGKMQCIKSMGGLGLYDNYIVTIRDQSIWNENIIRFQRYFNSIVYGFRYIYNMYKDIVLPLVWERSDGHYSAGTGFKYHDGIVTAKHCMTDVKNLRIKGYCASELAGKPVFISENEGIDIAFIHTGRCDAPNVFSEDGEVMQEVLVMGYPKIPAFTDFLTAEMATISSKAFARITPTMGTIAAYGNEYLSKSEALLITAKIRGGNSGGPVINQNGSIVGVACQLPYYDKSNSDYDDLGYGIAVPIQYVNDIITKKIRRLEIPNGFYEDYE